MTQHNEPQPARMANTNELAAAGAGAVNGAVWKLSNEARDMDANVISLAPGAEIGDHCGPAIDVLLHVFAGSGTLKNKDTSIELKVGDIIYLPALARRHFIASDQGLSYFSVHQRKKTMGLMPTLRQQ